VLARSQHVHVGMIRCHTHTIRHLSIRNADHALHMIYNARKSTVSTPLSLAVLEQQLSLFCLYICTSYITLL
jgi:hypothetical protein